MSTAKSTKKNKGRKSKATIFTHNKFRWLEQVARNRNLPALASAVCIEFFHYFSLAHDGAAWPAQNSIAETPGVRREAPSSHRTGTTAWDGVGKDNDRWWS
jgi:hypothetical protein